MFYIQAQLLQNDGAVNLAYWLDWMWLFCVARFAWCLVWWYGQLRWSLYCLDVAPTDINPAERKVILPDETDVLIDDVERLTKEAKDERNAPK